MTRPPDPGVSPWQTEIQAILRAAAGSFLFGIPLLYTVEVWAIGSATRPQERLAVLGATLLLAWLLTQVEGFRQSLAPRPLEAVLETVEATAIGLVCAALALALLRRITWETPLSEILGKLVFEGVPFALGAALARSTLSPEPRRRRANAARLGNALIDLDATLIGAVLIAFSIAPTEEVRLLASALPAPWLLLIVGASLGLSYTIVFAAGFTDRDQRQQRGLVLGPLPETLAAYLVALAASLTMLVLFQQLTPADPWPEWLSNVLVLGLPASVGGAAGRILI